MKKVVCFFALACMVFFFSSAHAHADDIRIKSDIVENERKMKTVEEEIKKIEKEKEEKSKKLVEANAELNELKGRIDELEADIRENSDILAEAEALEESNYKKFSERLRKMYEQGSNAYIGMILGSENLSDMIERVYMISEVSSHDREIYDKYKENKLVIQKKQTELETQRSELQSATSEFEQDISIMNEELESIISNLNEKRDELNEYKDKIESLNKSLSSMDYADQLFAEAEKYLGMPYVFGGSTPSTSFDCSGFVCYATTHSGVYNLPRMTAQGIYNNCIKITSAEAKRGDIIFFQGTYNAGETVTHVGFYAGDGKMLHCGNPIQYTSTQTPYWISHFYAYGRLKK